MLKFNPPPEPADFDVKARQPGNNWLIKNPDPEKRPKDYWSNFKSDLAKGFMVLQFLLCQTLVYIA
jgi:hypothetical protein